MMSQKTTQDFLIESYLILSSSKDGQSGTWMVWDPFKPKQFFSGLIVDSDFRLKAGPPSSRRSSSWSKRRAAGVWPKDCPHASFPPRPPPSSWSSATRRWRSWVCGPSWLIRGTGNRPVRRGIVCHFPGGTLKGRWMVRFYSETVREQNQTKWVFVFCSTVFSSVESFAGLCEAAQQRVVQKQKRN